MSTTIGGRMQINLIGAINHLGYGVATMNFLKALTKLGHEVALWPINNQIRWSGTQEDKDVVEKALDRAKFYNKDAPSVRLWHQFNLDQFPGRGKRVGFPIFELDKFNELELHHLSSVDELIVCSEWARKIIEDNGINVKASVVPLGVDHQIFSYSEELRGGRPAWMKGSTVFINIGKWEVRKGHDELLAAFNAAFQPGDDVELWMLNENPFIGHENDEWKIKYSETRMGANVKFLPRFENQQQMVSIFNQVDCGVFPAHAEGWNLEALELLACGAHVIATNYSGHTEFLDKQYSFLIEPNGLEVANDGKWFNGQGNWCSYDIEDLVEYMRMVHRLKQSGELDVNYAGIEASNKFSWENAAKKMVKVLSE